MIPTVIMIKMGLQQFSYLNFKVSYVYFSTLNVLNWEMRFHEKRIIKKLIIKKGHLGAA